MGVPRLGKGVPPCPDLGWGTPPAQTWEGCTPPSRSGEGVPPSRPGKGVPHPIQTWDRGTPSPGQVPGQWGGGGFPNRTQHSVHLLRSGWYVSCVHAGGLSCYENFYMKNKTVKATFDIPGKWKKNMGACKFQSFNGQKSSHSRHSMNLRGLTLNYHQVNLSKMTIQYL